MTAQVMPSLHALRTSNRSLHEVRSYGAMTSPTLPHSPFSQPTYYGATYGLHPQYNSSFEQPSASFPPAQPLQQYYGTYMQPSLGFPSSQNDSHIFGVYPQSQNMHSPDASEQHGTRPHSMTALSSPVQISPRTSVVGEPGSVASGSHSRKKSSKDRLDILGRSRPAPGSAAPGPIPATTPLVVQIDTDGVQWIAFDYSRDRITRKYTIRCDVDSVDLHDLAETFKSVNCVYPRAHRCKAHGDEYKGNRFGYETECNGIGWALAHLNSDLEGKRGLIQRAVDSWRNSNANQRMRSRRVRRQNKISTRRDSLAGTSTMRVDGSRPEWNDQSYAGVERSGVLATSAAWVYTNQMTDHPSPHDPQRDGHHGFYHGT